LKQRQLREALDRDPAVVALGAALGRVLAAGAAAPIAVRPGDVHALPRAATQG